MCWRSCASAALAVLTVATPARACDLALALAVDVSGSVDGSEYRLQMDGLAAGLRDSVIAEALVRGRSHLMLVQWTGSSRQNLTLPWTEMSDFAALDRFARDVTETPRAWRNYSTAIGEALTFTLKQFGDAPDCARRVIDVSGDGQSNEGLEPHTLRAALSRAGVTVNGIAIEASEPDLTAYYFENVIAGNGAFVVTAARFEDYAREIRRKLLREIVDQTALAHP